MKDLKGSNVTILERRGETILMHPALCLNMTMHQQLSGEKGNHAIEAVLLNPESKAAGTANWWEALRRIGDVVHVTHSDWTNGRASRAYETAEDQPLTTFDIDELAAQVGHEVNRVFCASIGDRTHLPWKETPPNIQQSTRDGAALIREVLDVTPEEQHNLWMKITLANGWTYGPVRNLEAKTHPALLPFDRLGPAQQLADWYFAASTRVVYGREAMDLDGMPSIAVKPPGARLLGIDEMPVHTEQMLALSRRVSTYAPDLEISPDMIVPSACTVLDTLGGMHGQEMEKTMAREPELVGTS